MIRLSRGARRVLALVAVAAVAAVATLWLVNDLRSARWQVTEPPSRAQNDTGPRVVRGPYLQSVTSHSAVVRWRTDVPTESGVHFTAVGVGDADAGATATHSEVVAQATTEHEVTLRHLHPGTAYEYSLGAQTGQVSGAPNPWVFHTAPEPNASSVVRVWALGDAGTASPGARSVRDAYLRFVANQLPDVWLMLGDNAYNTGTDLEFQAAVFETYADLIARLSLWPTRGNHDQSQSPGHAAYFDVFTLPTDGEAGGVPSGTEAFYAFDHGPVHFVCLDSYATDRSANGAMARWLVQDLQASHATWKVAFFHHPPYTRGTHDSDHERTMIEMRTNIVPLLEAGGVDLVLSGHSHNYERSNLLAGFYGASGTYSDAYQLATGGNNVVFYKAARPRGGTVYVVAGASGELGRRFMGLNHPAMAVSFATLGSLVLTFDDNEVRVQYVDGNAAVADSFTVRKDL
ncbi:MAG: metallophosphoesterase [Deltaproteobacteria bacterium]|nr:metallophosphoesterase [Deltaproteobacteria bacterium]